MATSGNERGRNWTEEEVYELIDVWSDDIIQSQLEGSQRNQHVYKKISQKLQEKGYERTWDQCRQKMKKLRKDYKDVVDNNGETGRKRKTFKYFDEIDAVLGCRPATRPNIIVSSSGGIEEEKDECSDGNESDDIVLSPVSISNDDLRQLQDLNDQEHTSTDVTPVPSSVSSAEQETVVKSKEAEKLKVASKRKRVKKTKIEKGLEVIVDKFMAGQQEIETKYLELEEKRIKLEAENERRRIELEEKREETQNENMN